MNTFNNGIECLYPDWAFFLHKFKEYSGSVDGFEQKFAEIESRLTDLQYKSGTTAALYRFPRPGFVVNSQADFDEFLHLYESGYTSRNCTIQAPGLYQFPVNAVFNGMQMHIVPSVPNVTIDLNGSVFYNSHLSFAGTAANHLNIVDNYSETRNAYFEECGCLFSYVDFMCLARFWSGWAYLSNCRFMGFTSTTMIDSIGAKLFLMYTEFIPEDIPAGYSVFGLGNDGVITLISRVTIWDSNNGGDLITARQNAGGTVNWYGSHLGYGKANASYTNTRRGKWVNLCPVSMPIIINTLDKNFFYMTAAAKDYTYMIVNELTTYHSI